MRVAPRTLFLVDAVGATCSAAMLAGVVARWDAAFGLPARVVLVLAGIAAAFAVYSLGCRLLVRRRWRPWLLGIAGANTSYMLVTIGVLYAHRGQLTRLGALYFALEFAIVAPLVWIELQVAVSERGELEAAAG